MDQHEYLDDPTIANDAALWRRIPPWHFVFDDNLGRVRPSTAAFDDDQDGAPMSVVLTDLVKISGRGPEQILFGHDGFALAEITAGLARSKNQGIQRDPQPDEPAHALVFGKKTDSTKRKLAKESKWVIAPP